VSLVLGIFIIIVIIVQLDFSVPLLGESLSVRSALALDGSTIAPRGLQTHRTATLNECGC